MFCSALRIAIYRSCCQVGYPIGPAPSVMNTAPLLLWLILPKCRPAVHLATAFSHTHTLPPHTCACPSSPANRELTENQEPKQCKNRKGKSLCPRGKDTGPLRSERCDKNQPFECWSPDRGESIAISRNMHKVVDAIPLIVEDRYCPKGVEPIDISSIITK